MPSYYELFVRLALACFLGGIIGFEREKTRHPAGFRTHILVCVGSALVMVCNIYMFEQYKGCLLYTSDAADDLICVDLGGRRIITKNNFNQAH